MLLKNRLTNTLPIIIHAPGGANNTDKQNSSKYRKKHPAWKVLFKKWRNEPPAAPGPDLSQKLSIITWNTSSQKSILELSMDKLGLTYTVLGRGYKNWSNPRKLDLAIKFLTTANTPYVLALDAYDVLMLRHPGEALKHFIRMNCEILFNGSKGFYPDFGREEPGHYITDTWKDFQKQVGLEPWPFINAGACFAKKDSYLAFAQDCWSRNIESLIRSGHLPHKQKNHRNTMDSDQLKVQWAFMDWYPRMQADCHAHIFLNISHLPRKDLLFIQEPYKMPFEWLAIHTNHIQTRFQSAISILLDKSRTLRGYLRLRKCQWKKDN